jgi:hypothetical protein
LKRITGIEDEPIGTLIYEGDEIEIGHNALGEEVVLNHKTSWANKVKGELAGAYATVDYKGIKRSSIMTMKEIRESWQMSQFNKEHKMFTGEFAKRTVINRVVKMILKTTNDDDLLAETMIVNENKHFDFEAEVIEAAETKAQLEIATNANTGEIIDVPEETPQQQPEPDKVSVNDFEEKPKSKVDPF